MSLVLDRPARPRPWHEPAHAAKNRRWSVRLPAGWPLVALFALYPLWWMLALPTFIYSLLAVPMAVELIRRRRVLVPPGFGWWLLLLCWAALSVLTLGQVPPDTLPSFGLGRVIGFTIRLVNYVGLTVIMLYVLNLKEHELPRLRVIRLLALMGLFTVIGGYAGVLAPHFSFISPLANILPESIGADGFVQRIMQVETAQVQNVIPGEPSHPRPSAPYEYTNTWGENLAILLIWLVVGWSVLGRGLRRWAGVVVAAAAVVPIVLSLNRGLWLGLGICAGYVALRLAWRGRFAGLGGLAAVIGVLVVLFISTPTGDLVKERFASGHSDEIRATLRVRALEAAKTSPILGYGANRPLIGSGRSIAVGKSEQCPQCGNREIGSDGQLSHLLIAQGFVGALCYNAFFLWNLWRFRRDHSAIGIAGSLVLVLMLFFQFMYGSLDATLAFALISVALLARNELHRRRQAAEAALEARSLPA